MLHDIINPKLLPATRNRHCNTEPGLQRRNLPSEICDAKMQLRHLDIKP
jgi:hypothetical protein